MSEAVTDLRQAAVTRALTGNGKASTDQRARAFSRAEVVGPAQALVEKVRQTAWKVTDEDVAAATKGESEDAVFELVVCAALGQASRQLEAALAALDLVTEVKS